MYECDATCQQIFEWFHSDDCKEDILVLWLSPRQEDSALLGEVIDNVYLIDAILQDKIAFLIVNPTGKLTAARIGDAHPLFNRLADLSVGAEKQVFHDHRGYPQLLVNATQSRVGSFANDMGVHPEDLPAIALVTKYYGDVLIAPFRGRINFSDLSNWLTELQAMIEKYRHEVEQVPQIPLGLSERINDLKTLNIQAESRKKEIIESMDRFYRRYPACIEISPEIREILSHPIRFNSSNCRAAWSEFEQALKYPEFRSASDHLPRISVEKNLRKLEDIEKMLEMVTQAQPSLSQIRELREVSYKKLSNGIMSLSSRGIGAKWIKPKPIQFGTVLPTVNKQLEQVIKLWKLVEQIIHGVSPPQ